jgi:nicotinamide-nucleotide amidase
MSRLDSADLARQVHERLLDHGQTLAVAESLTGGLVGATLTTVAGSSATFRGGLVVYATELKHLLAGVPADLLAQEGPVSRLTAEAMSQGVRQRLSADWGLALTGVAGPQPQDDQPVGTVHIALCGPSTREPAVRSTVLDGDRDEVRDAAVAAALHLVLDTLGVEDAGLI